WPPRISCRRDLQWRLTSGCEQLRTNAIVRFVHAHETLCDNLTPVRFLNGIRWRKPAFTFRPVGSTASWDPHPRAIVQGGTVVTGQSVADVHCLTSPVVRNKILYV